MAAFDFDSDSCCSIPDVTGSCAELYIDPGDTCIGDIDLMFPMQDTIVVCDGSIVDSIDVDETIEVYHIETSDCPNGYVHLRSFCELQFNWDTEQFEYRVSNNTGSYLRLSFKDADMLHGPARVEEYRLSPAWNADIVPAIRLLAWPPVTQSWISRERNHSWLSNAVVSEVQRNGCDLVPVSHRDYKHDSFQFRYSFSRAEVTLIRSWTPIQQLVYHMLRYFSKQTIIREWKDDDKVVCTYHIKTLILWACERKSPVWWESNCVIVLCSKLLETLMKWIGEKMCPHYFIPKWNLFEYKMKESRRLAICETLRIHIDIRTLSEWFRINYLSKVFYNGIRLNSLKNSENQHALDTIAASNWFNADFRTVLQKWIDEKYSGLISHDYDIATILHYHVSDWTARRLCWLIQSKNLAPELQFLNLAVALLRLAWNISGMKESEFSNHELLKVLSEVVLKLSSHDIRYFSKPCHIPFKQCSKWYFMKGVKLLSIYCKEHSAAYCLWVKTCKRYFKSALNIQDEYSESIHYACHVYLSTLYHLSGTNQETMIKHLLEAKKGAPFCGFPRCAFTPHTFNYSSLVFIDTVAHASGFCFLFYHVLRNRHALSDNGFTLTTIVYCLFLSVSQINRSNSSIKINRKVLTKHKFTSLFDICLLAISVHKYRRTTHTDYREIHKRSSNNSNNSLIDEKEMQFCLSESLEETLVKISVEMFTKYLDMNFITLTQIGFPNMYKIVSHFKALYYYRRDEYSKLLNLCNSIITEEAVLFSPEGRIHPTFIMDQCHQDLHCVSVLFAFQTLFRNDVTCLTGLIALIDPSCFSAIKDNEFIEK